MSFLDSENLEAQLFHAYFYLFFIFYLKCLFDPFVWPVFTRPALHHGKFLTSQFSKAQGLFSRGA